eukprot:1998378-Amphidinium_carterae.1
MMFRGPLILTSPAAGPSMLIALGNRRTENSMESGRMALILQKMHTIYANREIPIKYKPPKSQWSQWLTLTRHPIKLQGGPKSGLPGDNDSGALFTPFCCRPQYSLSSCVAQPAQRPYEFQATLQRRMKLRMKAFTRAPASRAKATNPIPFLQK